MRNKFILETHEYAPELNRIIFENGASLRTPNVKTIQEVRNRFFKPHHKKRLVEVRVEYIEEKARVANKIYNGFVDSMSELSEFLRELPNKHNAGRFNVKINGRFYKEMCNVERI